MGFEKQLLKFMAAPGYHPMKQHELARALNVDSKGRRAEFRHELYTLEQAGKVVRLRKNRWGLPEVGNQAVGIIKIMAKGGAIFIPEEEGESEIYISERNTGVALPNDKVAVEIFHSEYAARKRERRGQTDLRAEGRVVKVLERAGVEAISETSATPKRSSASWRSSPGPWTRSRASRPGRRGPRG